MITTPKVTGQQVADLHLPDGFEGLYDLAYNLWWSWSPEARQLFSAIDPGAWASLGNPVELLAQVKSSRWEELLSSNPFRDQYAAVMERFRSYMGSTETWLHRNISERPDGPIAYFSMEFGVHESLAIYSGGLGVLSGDHCKSASDLGVPLVGIGMLYHYGYFRQTIDADGLQQHTYPEYDYHGMPLRPALDTSGRPVQVRVPFPGREVTARVWLLQVGRVPVLLLDSDVVSNDPADRPITSVLYVRGREMRLCQELLLGVGGVRALRAVGIAPTVWHINEGHSALLQFQRLEELLGAPETEGDVERGLELLSSNTCFTTHTPVPAGHEQYDPELMHSYLRVWSERLGIDVERLAELGRAHPGQADQPFNLTALAVKTSTWRNGVSHLNAEVCDAMFRHLDPELPPDVPLIQPITNGVHPGTWLGPEVVRLFEQHLGVAPLERLLDAEAWSCAEQFGDEELWRAHQAQKERLAIFLRRRARGQLARHGSSPAELRRVAELFDPQALTIGFARRFATYKRADLLFRDLERLKAILGNPERPVQIVLSGKAHPADRPGQELIQHLFRLTQGELYGRVFFLENYDLRVARRLVQGCDLWLNTPRKPMEASGTSGQKAGMNGILNCSILDGWWAEGYEGDNGWAIGTETDAHDEWHQDEQDAGSLYHLLENEIGPMWSRRDPSGLPNEWLQRMRRSIASVGARFSSSRMVRDYTRDGYLPAAARRAAWNSR